MFDSLRKPIPFFRRRRPTTLVARLREIRPRITSIRLGKMIKFETVEKGLMGQFIAGLSELEMESLCQIMVVGFTR
ncbi:hypothetical protein GBA52_011625 [Prunus armeniaca]|nr:hypothetical protein GBA52_011625 [Prunus armeniaca]